MLTLNGKTVDTQNGYFSIRCPWPWERPGWSFWRRTPAGNQSKYSAVVERPWFSGSVLIWILCIVAGAALLAVYAVIFIRARRKKT